MVQCPPIAFGRIIAGILQEADMRALVEKYRVGASSYCPPAAPVVVFSFIKNDMQLRLILRIVCNRQTNNRGRGRDKVYTGGIRSDNRADVLSMQELQYGW